MKNVSRYLLRVLLVPVALALHAGSPSAQTPTYPYDHIHLNVPDTAAASAWYEKNLGGTRITEAPDRIMFGSDYPLECKTAANLIESLEMVRQAPCSAAEKTAMLGKTAAGLFKL